MFHVKHCKFSAGAGVSRLFCDKHSFFHWGEAYYNCFTWNNRCFDDNRRILAITVGWQCPTSTYFLVFRLFFHLLSPFSGLLSFVYVSTGHFRGFTCFLFFFIHFPSIYAEQVRAVSARGIVSCETLLSGCFAEKAITMQPVSPLCAAFSSKKACRLYSKWVTGYLRRFARFKTSHRLFRATRRLLKTSFRRPKRLIGSFKVTH